MARIRPFSTPAPVRLPTRARRAQSRQEEQARTAATAIAHASMPARPGQQAVARLIAQHIPRLVGSHADGV